MRSRVMTKPTSYSIRGGVDGRERLRLLARTLAPTTAAPASRNVTFASRGVSMYDSARSRRERPASSGKDGWGAYDEMLNEFFDAEPREAFGRAHGLNRLLAGAGATLAHPDQ